MHNLQSNIMGKYKADFHSYISATHPYFRAYHLQNMASRSVPMEVSQDVTEVPGAQMSNLL